MVILISNSGKSINGGLLFGSGGLFPSPTPSPAPSPLLQAHSSMIQQGDRTYVSSMASVEEDRKAR